MTTLQDNTGDTPPLKRHPALQPLSREHFNGLRLARRLSQAADQDVAQRALAVDEFEEAWHDEIAAHFDDEERLLSGLVTDEDAMRLRDEHTRLRGFVEGMLRTRGDTDPARLRQLGELLHDHIRWEERFLFQHVQDCASEDQLAHIAAATREVETIRPGSRRRNSSDPRD